MMHCGGCDAKESIRQKTVDAQDTTTGMEFTSYVVYCQECGGFGLGFTTAMAMLDFAPPGMVHEFAPDWKLPREWLQPAGGRHPEAARRVMCGAD